MTKKTMWAVFVSIMVAMVISCIADEPPNILFVISDDQSFRAIGSNGNQVIKTPHLDSLADAGMRFTHCFNMGSYSGAICLASRAMLNTGRHVWQAEAAVGTDTLWGEYFENAGYDTFISGKWHVAGGGLDETGSAAQAFETAVALGKGFYESPTQYGRPAANPEWAPDDITLLGHWSPEVWDITNHVVSAPYTVEKHTSELYADHAIDFLNARTEQSSPFFMYVSFNAPHDPRQAPTEYQELYSSFDPLIPPNLMGQYPYELASQRDDDTTSYPITEESYKLHLKEYYAMISHMDAQVGRVLAALDASGQADNTYVVFTSDQGLAIGEHGYMGKQILYDHSTRVPFFIKGPGISAGSTIDSMFYLQSIVPTTLELAGIPIPASIDFPSLTGLMNGSTNRLYDSIYGGLFASGMPQRMVRTEKYKLIMYPYLDTCLLYDLENDPWEATNLFTNPQYGQIANELLEQYQVWHTDLEDPYEMPFLDFSGVHVDDSETDKIVYTGSWNHIARSVSIDETISLNNQTGAAAELMFEGVDVRLYTQKGAGAGIFDIYLDEVLVDTYDCYSPVQVDQVKAFERKDLEPGTHTLRIVNTGTKNPVGTGYNVHLDMISYNRSGLKPIGLVDRTDEPGATITSQYADSPAGEGHDQLFDNNPTTFYVTSNSSSWVQHQFEDENKYTVKFYSITSPSEEPGPPPVNIVPNNSFELGGAAPTGWILSGGAVGSTNSAQDGIQSLRINAIGQRAYREVPTEVGKTYRLSVWIDASEMTGQRAVFDTWDEYDSSCQFVMYTPNAGWKEYTGTFTATDTSVRLRCFASHELYSGTVYYDNISVTEVQPPVEVSDKDPASWTLSGSNDGSNWFAIDSRSGFYFTGREQTWEFDVSDNQNAYEYYRLDATNKTGSVLKYAEIELFGYINEGTGPYGSIWTTVIPGDPGTGFSEDFDNDGLNNFYEYALDGDPEDILDVGFDPVFVKEGSTFRYIHRHRTDDSNLVYRVEATTDLVNGTWVPATYTVVGSTPITGEYDEVINEISTDDPNVFIRLKITEQ